MTIESDYGQVCLDAFINCENVLTKLNKKTISVSSNLINLLSECAHICMGTFHAIKNSSVNTPRLALLCVGICDECADVCESIENNLFKQCAQACRYCSDNISELAISDC
jgi:hypothetical protein